MSRRGGSLMRLRGLIRKEFLQIVRDPSSIAIAFVMPVFLLLLFGYGVSLDAKQVPIGLLVEQPSAETTALTSLFSHSEYFEPVEYRHIEQAEAAMRAETIRAFVWLRGDFARRLHSPAGVDIQLVINGVDANTARLIDGYVQGVWSLWLANYAQSKGIEFKQAIQLEPRIWFNSELRSRNFLVPGLIAIIMTLIGSLLTALVVAREWERGTMEALMVTRVAISEILLGKLIPYFMLGMGSMGLSVTLALGLFEVPLRGAFWLLMLASALFLLVALGMGLLISIVARSQFVAGQIALLATFLPAFLLSGFIFDIGSMPLPIQVMTHIVAARYFVALLQSIFLAGDVWAVILPNAAALLVMALFFLGISRKQARKRLD